MPKLYSLRSKFQACISKGRNRSYKKFNLSKFKAEHPSLYKKYLETTYSSSIGGVLTVKKINNTDYKDLILISTKGNSEE